MVNEKYLAELLDFPKQIEQASLLGKNVTFFSDIKNIVVTGMGGSAGFARFVEPCMDLTVPLILNSKYTLPRKVNENTLLIVVSYSGNTEETITALQEGLSKTDNIVIIASGGKLLEIARQKKLQLIEIPSGMQPRAAIAYLLFPLLNLLEENNLIEEKKYSLEKILAKLKSTNYEEKAQILAKKFVNKIVIIHTSSELESAAHKWKISLNENGKAHAFYNLYPELNHNEIVGFTKSHKDIINLIIEDQEDHPMVKKRMRITKELLHNRASKTMHIKTTGETLSERIFALVHLASLTSFFVAQEKGLDPEPVDIVENLKEELKK
jgi:glucose/mannose-6-phosphate isomerase